MAKNKKRMRVRKVNSERGGGEDDSGGGFIGFIFCMKCNDWEEVILGFKVYD